MLCISMKPTLIRQRTLPKIVSYSDNIIIGEVVALSDTNFKLKVLQTIKGEKKEVFTLKRKVWEQTQRWQNYKIGQIEIALLSFDTDDNTWELATKGGESELLIQNDSIYLFDKIWYLKGNENRYLKNLHRVSTMNTKPYDKKEMISAMIDYSNEYKLIEKKLHKERDIKDGFKDFNWNIEDVKFKNKFLIEFCKRSLSHERLVYELIDDPRIIDFIYP